ncbi:PREDICTED: ankyrin repeat and LEM domain-containing protein 1 [Crocodylus porosus]|uniref:ankyrin repeat and LEM domain-containing protein 1 n=1 Tax=Crocodylus porosus TaxID=8502 RepID=UPI00093E6B45|nr:PREDICTED: ankyrin repeat and LEM domain-containing protein 1 [Crocodylus porosus]
MTRGPWRCPCPCSWPSAHCPFPGRGHRQLSPERRVTPCSRCRAVEALLKQGADPNLVLPEGVAAVHLAAGKERESGVRCLQLVLQYGGDPNARSAEELTPLHVAASWGCYKCLKLLLRKGGDPDLEDQDGSRAIDLAMEQGNTMCVQILQDFQRARAWPEFSPDGPGRAGSPPQPLTADSTDCSVFSWLSEAGSAPPSSTRKWLPNGSPREMGLDVAFPDTTGSQAEPPPTWFCFSTRRDPGARGQPAWPQPLLCSTLLSTSNGPRGGAWSLPAAPEEEPAEAEDSLAQLGTLQPWHCPHSTQRLGPRAALRAGEALSDETVAVHSPWQPGSTRQTPGSSSPCESHGPLPSCSSRDTREPCPVPHSLAQPDGFLDPATRDWEGLDATSPDHAYLFCWAHSTALHNLDKTVMVPASLEKAPEISSGPLESSNSQYSSCDSKCYVSTVEASDPVEAGRDGRATGGTADTVLLSRATGGTADTVPLSRAMAGTVPMSRAGENTDGEESEASALLLQCLGSPDSAPRGTSFANSTGTPRSSSLPPCLAHCHITPRTKSRLYASTARGNSSSSSSSLFDETLELPQRTQRVRRPPETSRMPVSRAGGLLESTRASYCEAVESGSLDETVVLLPAASLPAASGQSSAPSTSPTVLQSPAGVTRLHAPETTGPCPPRMEHPSTAGPPSSPPGPGESSWLTEEDCSECPGLGAPVRPPTTTTSTQDWFGSELGSVEPSQSLAQGLGGLQLGGKKPSSRSRVSFSRLSAARPALAAPGSGRLSPVPDTDDPGIPLSPGGRPTNHGAGEAVEYLYLDEEKGHALIERHVPPTENTCCSDTSSEDTIIYDWRACASQRGARENRLVPACSDEALLRKLQKLGADPGPVTDSTRNLYMQQLDRLQSSPGARAGRGATGHSPELSAALETLQIPDCQADEVALAAQFDQPDKARKWREGVLKSSFNYLLLDPRVTQNLPLRCHTLSPAERFQTFVRAIFYVGKGKRARPYCHLYEALAHYRGGKKQACAKVRHILDIWAGGQGVVSVHCFQNVIPVEAYTREACMVDALGLAMLTNQKRGNCYGVAAGWLPRRRRRLGVHLLHRALQIFLAEGERQLRPADIQVGQ